jgi:hypothetical protein
MGDHEPVVLQWWCDPVSIINNLPVWNPKIDEHVQTRFVFGLLLFYAIIILHNTYLVGRRDYRQLLPLPWLKYFNLQNSDVTPPELHGVGQGEV